MRRGGRAGSTVRIAACCAAVAAAAVAPQASGQGVKPYFADSFTYGIRAPWSITPANTDLVRLVQGKKGSLGLGLVTTDTSGGPPQSEMTAVWLSDRNLAHAGWDGKPVSGQSTWYRLSIRFPRGGRYEPTTGTWNWVVAWHNDARTAAYPHAYSIALGVFSDYPAITGKVGRAPRLAFRLMGGSVLSPSVYTVQLRRNSLRRGHWYNLLFHFVWSTNADIGRAEWWVDGVQKMRVSFPTLYSLPDATQSYNEFGLYNYRWHAPWSSEVDFDNVAIGPTRGSVSGR